MVSGGATEEGVFDLTEDILGSASVVDVNVEVLIKDVFESLDNLEESMTSCSVLSPVVSINWGVEDDIAAEGETDDNDDVRENALDPESDLDVTVDVFTEDIFETVVCLEESKVLISVNWDEGDVDENEDNVCVVILGTAVILDVKLDVFTEETFDTVDCFVESIIVESCLDLSPMLSSAAEGNVADGNVSEDILGTVLVLDVTVDVTEDLCEPADDNADW